VYLCHLDKKTMYSDHGILIYIDNLENECTIGNILTMDSTKTSSGKDDYMTKE